MQMPFRVLSPVNLGRFSVPTGRIIVSDPSYDPTMPYTPHCRPIDVLKGDSVATSIQFEFEHKNGSRTHCAELIARHNENNESEWLYTNWCASNDTGQAGFFDSAVFCDDTSVPVEAPPSLWTSATFLPLG